MSPIMKRAVDVLIAIALTAAVVFVVVAGNNFLLGRGSVWQGFNLWFNFIKRPDILGIMILTAFVAMAYVFWQQTRYRK